MNSPRAHGVPLVAAILAIGLTPNASAYTGDDPVLATGIASCTYGEITAHIGPDNSVKYKIYGSCRGSTVSGETAYRDGKFQESFVVNGAKIRTSGYCDSDPWATAVNCHDQQVQSSGVIVDQSLYSSPPLTLLSGDSGRFHQAFQNASRPNPPGVPVNFAASSVIGRVKTQWLAPDTSGDRPVLDFLLQARPLKAEGAGWVDLGRVPWHAAPDYQLNAKLPPTSAAIQSWDVRLCATTKLASTCTPSLTPDNSELVTEMARKDRAPSVFEQNPPAATPSVKALGRVATAGTAAPAVSICDSARNARARNSPAAPGLEAQCIASGGSLNPPLKAIDAAQLDELAAKGGPIAEADPLALALRDEQSGEPGRRGFDIGMAAAENQTAPGPGKQRIHDALPQDQQAGYAAAVAFSLERNSNAEFYAKGVAIDAADPTVAEARDADPDVFFRLGFDIASGIFGDPALGAQGNKSTGPGSLKIRDALSAAGQRGFNAAVEFHLARQYQ